MNELIRHAAVAWQFAARRHLASVRGERGQGTVEYVGLILLVSLLMVGMVAAMKTFNGAQGRVEYVGLILLVAMLMVGMVAAMKGFNGTSGTEIAEVIITKIKQAVNAITFR